MKYVLTCDDLNNVWFKVTQNFSGEVSMKLRGDGQAFSLYHEISTMLCELYNDCAPEWYLFDRKVSNQVFVEEFEKLDEDRVDVFHMRLDEDSVVVSGDSFDLLRFDVLDLDQESLERLKGMRLLENLAQGLFELYWYIDDAGVPWDTFQAEFKSRMKKEGE